MYCKFLETNIIALKISYTNPGLMAFQTAYVDEASATISCKRKIYQLCKGILKISQLKIHISLWFHLHHNVTVIWKKDIYYKYHPYVSQRLNNYYYEIQKY